MTKHHRCLLALHLKQIDAIARIDQAVDAHVEPFRTAITQLKTVRGIGDLVACVILAEIGHDMSRFPTQRQLISWAGLCPKNDENAGKRRFSRMRNGAPWLTTSLIQCAWAAARTKGSYLQAQFHRLRACRGAKKAIGAVAASILTAAYHMLGDGTFYHDLGADHFDRRAKGATTKRLIAKLESRGYNVTLTPIAA
jgi:transposase